MLLLALGLVSIAGSGESLGLAPGFRVCGLVACMVFVALLVYSLFVEIPFRETYGSAGAPASLVTTGTYGLCRHPGVLWFIGGLAGFAIAVDSPAALAAVPVWGGLDIAYAYLQDRFFFPRMFASAYREYQRTVPFLVPTRKSIRRCMRTLGRSHTTGATDGKRD
jgi:protein-S-isoprenylcysteine O-methyltransferase Ste14